MLQLSLKQQMKDVFLKNAANRLRNRIKEQRQIKECKHKT
jgi:hypothetical protein